MSNERGVYQPQDEFASYEDYPEEEGRSRLPLMIVIALVVLAAFAGVVWLAYNQGVSHGRQGTPPIVAAPAGPTRTPPDETQTAAGGPTTPYTGLKVYGEPVPPDEEAASSALAPQATEPTPSDITVATQAPPPAAAPVPAPAVPETHPIPEVVIAPQVSTPAPAPAPTQPRPQTQVAHAPVTTTTTTTTASRPPATLTPAPAPAPLPPAQPQPQPQTQVATVSPPPAPAATEPTVSAHTDAAATSGGAVLQVGSYPSDALAENAWKSMRAKHATALTGLSRDVKAAQLPGKGTWYRLRLGPFASRAEANAKCAELKATGMACIVAAP